MTAAWAAATKRMAAKNSKTSMAMWVMFRLGGWRPRRNPSSVLYLSCEHGESSVTRHCPPPYPAVSGLLLPAPTPPVPSLVLLPPCLTAPVRSLYLFSPLFHFGLTAVTHPSRLNDFFDQKRPPSCPSRASTDIPASLVSPDRASFLPVGGHCPALLSCFPTSSFFVLYLR